MNVLTSVLTVAVIVLVDASPAKYYATKYDHLDIEEILNNRRMVYYYANCLLNRGPCPPQGLDLRRILPEALETNCLRCTEKQKVVTYRSIKRLMKEYPKTWALLQAQWDPKDIYVKRFEESFKNTPSTVPPENEIIIEDRFGGNSDVATKPSTTKRTKSKKSKPVTSTSPVKLSTPATIKTSRIPPINSIASGSKDKPSRLPQTSQNAGPQNVGANVAEQVGQPNQEEDLGSKRQLTSTSAVEIIISSTPRDPSSSTISLLTTPLIVPTTQNSPVGVTFDIPQSSINHPQTQELLRNNSIAKTNSRNVSTPAYSPVQKNPSSTRQMDPISSLVLSFLNANRPTTIRPKTTSTTTTPPENLNLQIKSQKISGHVTKPGKRAQLGINTTVQVSLRKPLIQVRLPGLTVDNQVQQFNPVGNFVRGLANAGDRLIETGTSIADSVLTSVRGLFNARTRRNRALRRS